MSDFYEHARSESAERAEANRQEREALLSGAAWGYAIDFGFPERLRRAHSLSIIKI
jgi:hypothetical protein